MKRIRTMTKPTRGLSSYLGQAEDPRYREFRDYEGGTAYKELVAGLMALQRGLCGYCEISLTDSHRQIEHIAPQSRHPERALDTTNMMAACQGGSSQSEDEDRFLKPPKRNLSCGQAKGDREDPQFVDPRTLPALPSLLAVLHDGRVHADPKICRSEDETARIEKTIAMLGLNVERLRAARERRWRDLFDTWAPYFEKARTMIQAAEQELLPREDGRLPSYFTTRRSFFGSHAEQVLGQAADGWV